jgi:hypothetical protein
MSAKPLRQLCGGRIGRGEQCRCAIPARGVVAHRVVISFLISRCDALPGIS